MLRYRCLPIKTATTARAPLKANVTSIQTPSSFRWVPFSPVVEWRSVGVPAVDRLPAQRLAKSAKAARRGKSLGLQGNQKRKERSGHPEFRGAFNTVS